MKWLLLISAFYLQSSVLAQSVEFEKKTYEVNQPITVNIISNGDVGIENDIRKVSELINVSNYKNYSLGVPKYPGFYKFNFYLTDKTKKDFQVLVLPIGYTSSEDMVLELKASAQGIFDKFFSLTEADQKNIITAATKEYIGKFAVSATTTFVVCVASAPGGPVTFTIACGKQVAGNAKDFLIVYIETASKKMVDKGMITKEEGAKVVQVANAGGLVYELATANFIVENGSLAIRKIGSSAIENIAALSTFTSTKIENKDIEFGVIVSGDFGKKVQAVLEIAK